jgi:hypothetical protein
MKKDDTRLMGWDGMNICIDNCNVECRCMFVVSYCGQAQHIYLLHGPLNDKVYGGESYQT